MGGPGAGGMFCFREGLFGGLDGAVQVLKLGVWRFFLVLAIFSKLF